MAKRDNATAPTGDQTPTNDPGTKTPTPMEARLFAFAEELGRIAGTIQAKAEGWLDSDTLKQQIASVRDGASQLLDQFAGAATKARKETTAAAAPRGKSKGRSGGVVDAPGKKHRKPTPSDPKTNTMRSQAAKLRTARTMVKTERRRGRG